MDRSTILEADILTVFLGFANYLLSKDALMTAARAVIALFCSLAGFAALAANPITLPPSATPGAVEPGRAVSPPKNPNEYYLFELQPANGKAPEGDEGERTFVRSIIVRGVTEYPSKGILLNEIRKLIEKFRLPEQGVKKVIVDGSRQATQDQGGKKNQSQPEGASEKTIEGGQAETEVPKDPNAVMLNAQLTIGQLQDIAGQITNYYRKKGFILAQAYVPEQKVINGDVVIQVAEGKLGHIVVENNHLYGRGILLKPFNGYVGKPVFKQSMESGLLRLTDYPGLSVFGVFRPGPDVGTTDLVLKVQDESRLNFNVQLDNYGSKFTGNYRLRGDFSLNNLSGAADMINGSLMETFDPSNGIYGALSYERPFADIRDSGGIGFSRNAYDIGGDLAASGISGTSEITQLFLRRSYQRGIQNNSYGLLSLARKFAELSPPIDTTDKLLVVSAEYSLNSVSPDFSKANIGLIRISRGLGGVLGAMQASNDPNASRHGGSGKNAGGDFNKLEFRYDRVQRFIGNQSLLITVSGQFSKDLLTSIEQMPLGGPTSVRAYPISEFLVDSGYFATLEWTVRAPGFSDIPAFGRVTWGQVLQVAVFADVAGGTINDPLPTDRSSVNISGVGAGLRFNFGGISAHMDLARPVTGVSGQNVREIQAYINIIYNQ